MSKYKVAPGKLTKFDLDAIKSMQARGFAVVVWTPAELGKIDPREFEEAMLGIGDTVKAWS